MEIRRLINKQSASRDIHHQPSKGGSTSTNNMQNKKLIIRGSESLRSNNNKSQLQVHVPDLTDFMNDMFFGTLNNIASDRTKAYNLTGTADRDRDHDHRDDRTVENSAEDDHEESLDEGSSRKSTSGRSTEEWLVEARRLVASSPSRCDSPSRLVGSPRFAAAAQGAASPASVLDRRDPLSRSARRHRAVESFSGEIISKSAGHSRNKSETFTNTNDNALDSPSELSPTSAVHRWFSDMTKPSNPTPPPQPQSSTQLPPQPPTNILSRRQSLPRKSRFQQSTDPSSPRPQGIPTPPPAQAGPNRLGDPLLLSPPKNLVESAQRRSISSSTCSSERINITTKKPNSNGSDLSSELSLNAFLKCQRTKLDDGDAKARIVLSGPSNSASSMVAAICYAWLLENRARKERKRGQDEYCVVLPVMNVKRATMWKFREASWLFYHVGLDVASLLFADEVDLEGLVMDGKLSMLVIGQDVLRTNGEVRSQCTILTDNYCEEAYDLLQTPMLKKLLLAAILLDTQNLNFSSQLSMTRDAEAVQLLLVGSKPNYRNALFDQLTQDQRDDSFLDALRQSYGKPPNENGHETKAHVDRKVLERKSPSISHHEATSKIPDKKSNDAKSAKTNKVSPKSEKPSSSLPQGTSGPLAKVSPTPDASRGKNKFFLAKWFGFGSK